MIMIILTIIMIMMITIQASGAWRLSPGFHDLIWSARFRLAAYQLLGGPCRFLHDQIFCKPPAPRCPQSWFGFHQDLYYWSWTAPMQHLTCWVALDDSTEDNGCLQYVAGSHRWCPTLVCCLVVCLCFFAYLYV